MAAGLDNLKHIVVLMMENRSFDHMLGALRAENPLIDGLTGTESNPDGNGGTVTVQPKAAFQGQLSPDPDHHFPAVDLQIFNGGAAPTMQGFVRSYFNQRRDANNSKKIMFHFAPDKLPVLTGLARQFVVFNKWFASIPGPTLCNRAFAHYGTSFGHVGMELTYLNQKYKSIYERVFAAGRTSKLYYFDVASSTLELTNLIDHQSQFFGTFEQFIRDCKAGTLPDYSFVEPNYSDHSGPGGGELVASDQHPDHHVREGERFIASVYNAIRLNDALWQSTALLIVYDEHGGIYDHVPPPACTPDDDDFVASPAQTGTAKSFAFDRLGVRVPAILVSPWVDPFTVVNDRVFDHASIPATITEWLPGMSDDRARREKTANTFLDLLSRETMRTDCPMFRLT